MNSENFNDSMGTAKVLFVDDDRNVLLSLKRLFRDEPFEIITEEDVNAALETIRQHEFSVIVSDFRMPVMNGVEFLKEARRFAPESLRIILTGHADVETSLKAINEGHVYKFLTKPWDDESFRLQIGQAVEFQDLLIERKRLTKELFQANEELEEMNKNLESMVDERTRQLLQSEKMATLGQIAAQIGHEINNALQLLKGNLHFASVCADDPQRLEKYIGNCGSAVDQLAIYARNLLTIGKPKPSEFSEFDVRDVVEATMNKLDEINVLKHYDVVRDFTESSAVVFGDPVQIDQMVTNLIINAHHAMNRSGRLTVGIEIDGKNETIILSVGDTGHGIPPDDVDKIFEPFFTTKPEGKGTGLGLPVIQKIVENHLGKISVQSVVGQGTTFSIQLPLQNTRQVNRYSDEESEYEKA